MPRPRTNRPAYRHYRPKNLAVVRIEGKDHYLGPYGSEASYERYHRLIADSFARSGSATAPAIATQSSSDRPTYPPRFAGTTAHYPRATAPARGALCAPTGTTSNTPCVPPPKVEYCHPWLGLRDCGRKHPQT